MEIRELKYEDEREFIKIIKESGFVSGYPDDSIGEFFKDRSDMIYIGAFDGDAIVGVLSLTIGNSSYKLSPFAWCDDLYVRENHRKKGLGRKLLGKAEEIAKRFNCSNILLGVGETEKDTISFYETAGYRDMNCRLMTRPLTEEDKKHS